jgi:hypothetical protein
LQHLRKRKFDIWHSDVDPEIDKAKLGSNVGTHLTAPSAIELRGEG